MDRGPNHRTPEHPGASNAISAAGVVALRPSLSEAQVQAQAFAPDSSDSSGSSGASPSPSASEPTAICFRTAYDENVRFVWRSLRRLGVHPSDVEDACQEVFLVVHKRLDSFDRDRSLPAWIFGIAFRVAAKYRRRAHVRYEQAEAAPEDVAAAVSAPDQSASVQKRQAMERLDRILSELNDSQRAVFMLYELEQLSMNEVATLVDCPLQTAYSRLHTARKHVQAAIARGQEQTSGIPRTQSGGTP
jgi:RNA polymerase sigma-70 factor, ECF subfamily